MDKNVVITMILHGCELARKLEGSLPRIVNQPSSISESCAEIIRSFMAAWGMLNDDQHQTSPFSRQLSREMGSSSSMAALGVEEWLRSSCYSQDRDDQRMMESHRHEHEDFGAKMIGGMLCERNEVACEGKGAGGGAADHGVGGSIQFQRGRSSGSSRPESSSLRPRRSGRKERDGRRTIRMAAPKIGNTEIPPEDGFTWRKYGQKEILGSRFPRAYFRCTHQRLYHCPAKKQVQRLDDDPDTFEVTYRNDHTCNKSATAPSPSVPHVMSQQHPLPGTNVGTSLYMGIGSSRPTLNFNQFLDPSPHSYGRLYGGEAGGYNYTPVLDMADTMFNSGSSGNSSMDQIFSSNATNDVNGK